MKTLFQNNSFVKLLKTQTKDGAGSFSIVYSEIPNSDFQGKLDLINANYSLTDDRSAFFSTHKLFCSDTIQLINKERIKDKDSLIEYEIQFSKVFINDHQEVLLKAIN